MYTDLLIDGTNYTFQLKDEAGSNIGSATVYTVAGHTTDNTFQPGMLCVFELDVANKVWPPVAAYPMDRLIIHH